MAIKKEHDLGNYWKPEGYHFEDLSQMVIIPFACFGKSGKLVPAGIVRMEIPYRLWDQLPDSFNMKEKAYWFGCNSIKKLVDVLDDNEEKIGEELVFIHKAPFDGCAPILETPQKIKKFNFKL